MSLFRCKVTACLWKGNTYVFVTTMLFKKTYFRALSGDKIGFFFRRVFFLPPRARERLGDETIATGLLNNFQRIRTTT